MSGYIPRRQIIKQLKQHRDFRDHIRQLLDSHIKQKFVFLQTILARIKLGLINLLSQLVKLNTLRLSLFQKLKRLLQWSFKLLHYQITQTTKHLSHLFGLMHFANRLCWKLRLIILPCLFLAITINNFALRLKQEVAFPLEIKQLNYYPTLPTLWLQLATIYNKHNQEKLAWEALDKARNYTQYYPSLLRSLLFNNAISTVEQVLTTPMRRREQLRLIQKMETKYPYSWQLLALKARYYKELYRLDEYQSSLETALWLSPAEPVLDSLSQGN